MNGISQKQFYNGINPQYLRYEDNKPYAAYLVGKIVGLWKAVSPNVLEIGAGQGRFTFELAKHAGYLTATDISGKELSILAKLKKLFGRNNILTEEYDVRGKRNKYKNKFEAIAGFHVLHHIPKNDYLSVARNLKEMVKKGGVISFIEPNNLYPFHIVEMMITPDMKWEIEKGIYTNYIGSFKKACLREGLTLTVCRKFGFFPPPFINKFPWITELDRIFEEIPLINELFCPFVLLTFRKND